MIFRTPLVASTRVTAAAAAAVALFASGAAYAQSFEAQGSVNFGAPPPVYQQPQPVYQQPQPVYVQQQPVYVQQQPVYVQQPVYRRRWYAHDGFFLRGAVGLGYSVFMASTSAGSGNLVLSGPALNADVAAGFVIAPNLAIHLTADYTGIFSPSVSTSAGGTMPDTSGTTYNTELFGGGLTYWFAPVNFFASVSGGAALMQADLSYGGSGTATLGQSNVGVGVNVLAGWDFPLSPWWALGISGQFIYAHIPDSDGVTTWDNISGAVLVQLTNY